MTKARKNSRGFRFEHKIDLSKWVFNALDYDTEKAFDDFEEGVQKSIEKEREKLNKRLGSVEKKIMRVASEALQISFEKNISVGFWEVYSKPELLHINFEDFSEDGYNVSVNLKEAIRDCLLDFCGKDGYVRENDEWVMIQFADMLKELETEVRTAIKPKETE